jgi:tetratricopeptide (TPR) repeat protein
MDSTDADDQRIQRWLDCLRDGSEPDKIAARRGLARVFEQRGMLEEAIELLESNIQVGVRSAETLRWLSRLYQAQGDEARSLEAAVNASRDQLVSPESEAPEAVEVGGQPRRPRALRHLTPYLLMLLGLGIAVAAILWMLAQS